MYTIIKDGCATITVTTMEDAILQLLIRKFDYRAAHVQQYQGELCYHHCNYHGGCKPTVIDKKI
jgi:hypothetical protein